MEIRSTGTAAANRQDEAEVTSQDKRRRKRGKHHYYDADVGAKITKSACEKKTGCQIGQYTENTKYKEAIVLFFSSCKLNCAL